MDAAPQIWREAKLAGELVSLRRSRLLDRPPTHLGRGLPVLLVPGLLAPDRSLTLVATLLKRNGFRPRRSGIASNVDCSEREMERLERRVARAASESGLPVAIVGHSRGGLFARALAVRHPDLVAGIVCLGSPLVDPLANVHPLLHLQLELIASLGDRRLPRLATHGCIDGALREQIAELAARSLISRVLARKLGTLEPGECCRRFWSDVRAPFPERVSYLSIYSRGDGVVSHRACLDPAARHREVRSSHCGMAFNVDVFRSLLAELRDVAERERRPAPAPSPAAARAAAA